MSKLLGFELMVNFSQPYLASSIKDFWRKWHISLSTWFRDYLYIPLGGSKRTFSRTIYNILIVFVTPFMSSKVSVTQIFPPLLFFSSLAAGNELHISFKNFSSLCWLENAER